jgi:hypothetical protein
MFRRDPGRFDLAITDMTMPGLTGIGSPRAFFNPPGPIILVIQPISKERAKAIGIRELSGPCHRRIRPHRTHVLTAKPSEPLTLLKSFK